MSDSGINAAVEILRPISKETKKKISDAEQHRAVLKSLLKITTRNIYTL